MVIKRCLMNPKIKTSMLPALRQKPPYQKKIYMDHLSAEVDALVINPLSPPTDENTVNGSARDNLKCLTESSVSPRPSSAAEDAKTSAAATVTQPSSDNPKRKKTMEDFYTREIMKGKTKERKETTKKTKEIPETKETKNTRKKYKAKGVKESGIGKVKTTTTITKKVKKVVTESKDQDSDSVAVICRNCGIEGDYGSPNLFDDKDSIIKAFSQEEPAFDHCEDCDEYICFSCHMRSFLRKETGKCVECRKICLSCCYDSHDYTQCSSCQDTYCSACKAMADPPPDSEHSLRRELGIHTIEKCVDCKVTLCHHCVMEKGPASLVLVCDYCKRGICVTCSSGKKPAVTMCPPMPGIGTACTDCFKNRKKPKVDPPEAGYLPGLRPGQTYMHDKKASRRYGLTCALSQKAELFHAAAAEGKSLACFDYSHDNKSLWGSLE